MSEVRSTVPVEVSVRFERFPASVKGALLMRGADGNPHAVRLEEAVVARIPSKERKPITMGEVLVDVAPARDLFVPFEFSISDLDPGWYEVACLIQVDGAQTWSFSGRPFCIPWSRGRNRRSVVRVGRSVRVGGTAVMIDRVEMGADRAVVVWRPEGPDSSVAGAAEPVVILLADGRPLDPLAGEPGRGEREGEPEHRTATYPVPREVGSLRVVLRLPREESDPIDVPLA